MKWFSYQKPCARFFGEVALFDQAEGLLSQIGDDTGLEFFINCNGGDSGNAFKIVEALQGRVKVATIHRQAISAAFIIALTAERIVMTRGSRIVIHEPQISVFGHRDRVLLAAESLDELTAKLAATLSDRRGIKHKTCYGWYSDGEDHVFTAEEALAVGLVDEIIAPPPVAAIASPFPMIETPSDDGKASLLLELLNALGPIRTADADRLRRELYHWQFSQIQQSK